MIGATTPLEHLAGTALLGAVSDPFVYTWTGQRISYSQARLAPPLTAPLVRLLLDDGTTIEATPDQRFVRRDGTVVAAQHLTAGVSMLPCYTRLDHKGYRTFREAGTWHHKAAAPIDRHAWRRVSRLVAETKYGRRLSSSEQASFVNGDRTDMRPDNIELRNRPLKRFDPLVVVMGEAKQLLADNADLAAHRNHKVVGVEHGGCFAAGSLVYVIESSMVTPVPIEKLALDPGRTILVYDEQKKILRAAQAKEVRLVRTVAPVIKVPLTSGATLHLTTDHKVLTLDGYIEAGRLQKGNLLVGAAAGFEYRRQSVLTHNHPGTVWVQRDPSPATTTKVYDVTTETGNLLVDGVICHNSGLCHSIWLPEPVSFAIGGLFAVPDTHGTT